MKRSELVRELVAAGCVLHRHGAKHDVYVNPANGKKQPVPRHVEIDNQLAKHQTVFSGGIVNEGLSTRGKAQILAGLKFDIDTLNPAVTYQPRMKK